MTALQSKVLVGVGLCADAVTAAASYIHLVPERQTFVSPDRMLLRRAADHPLNAGFPPIVGPIDIEKAYECAIPLSGLSGNNGGAIDPDSKTDATRPLDALLGTASIDPAGAASNATQAGSDLTTSTVVVVEQARFPVGTVVGILLTSGAYVWRQVRARAGSSGSGALTLDRPATGTVADAQPVIRCSRWKDDPSVYEHQHLGFLVEHVGQDKRIFIGGMGNWAINLARGRFAELVMSNLKFTDVQDASHASPTSWVRPTTGAKVVRNNNQLWIGDDAWRAIDIEIVGGGAVEPVPADDSPHGAYGYTVQKGGSGARTKLRAKICRGTGTGEVLDSTGNLSANDIQSFADTVGEEARVWDVAVQAGRVPGSLYYGSGQSMVFTKRDPVVVNGIRWIDVELEAFDPGDSNLAQWENHLG